MSNRKNMGTKHLFFYGASFYLALHLPPLYGQGGLSAQDPCRVKYMVETVEGYIYHLKTNSNREPDYTYFLIEYNKVRSSLGMPKACALDQVDYEWIDVISYASWKNCYQAREASINKETLLFKIHEYFLLGQVEGLNPYQMKGVLHLYNYVRELYGFPLRRNDIDYAWIQQESYVAWKNSQRIFDASDYLQNLFEEVTSQLNKITGKCAAKDRASRLDCQRVLYQYNYIREQHGELPVVSLDDIDYAWLSKRKEEQQWNQDLEENTRAIKSVFCNLQSTWFPLFLLLRFPRSLPRNLLIKVIVFLSLGQIARDAF